MDAGPILSNLNLDMARLVSIKNLFYDLFPNIFFLQDQSSIKSRTLSDLPTYRTIHTINSKCKQVTDFSTSCLCGKEKNIIPVRGRRGVSYISYKSVISYLSVQL